MLSRDGSSFVAKKKTAHFMTITPVSKSFPLSKKVFLMLENQQKGSIYYGKCLKAP